MKMTKINVSCLKKILNRSEKFKKFEKQYHDIYKKFPIRISSIAYDATHAVIKLVNDSRRGKIDLEDFMEYDNDNNQNGFSGIDGLFRFLPNGIVQRNLAILKVENGDFRMIEEPLDVFFKY